MTHLTIKFSHNYPKLHSQPQAELLAVRVLQAETMILNGELIEYDTIYYDLESGSRQYYPLPKTGQLIQLIFLGNRSIPFCTIRRHTPEKERYYHGAIGRVFDVVIEEEK